MPYLVSYVSDKIQKCRLLQMFGDALRVHLDFVHGSVNITTSNLIADSANSVNSDETPLIIGTSYGSFVAMCIYVGTNCFPRKLI